MYIDVFNKSLPVSRRPTHVGLLNSIMPFCLVVKPPGLPLTLSSHLFMYPRNSSFNH